MKININFVLDEKGKKWAEEANAEISKRTNNEIEFSSGKYRPHITLLMGQVEEENVSKVKEIVRLLDFSSLNKKILFKKPYIKGSYVFVDVVDDATFKHDCDNLLKSLKDLIVPHKYLISDGNPPHITLGYSKNATSLKEYVENITIPTIVLKEIVVSRAGEHGTVICEEEILEK